MAVDVRLGQLAAALCLAILASSACAAESALDLTLPDSKYYSENEQSFLVADNEAAVGKAQNTIAATTPAAEFEPKLITGKTVHEYLGLGTLVMAGLTTLTAPGDTCATCARPMNGTHAELAKATAVMALATVASGLIVHWDDFHLEDGWKDPDNQHVVLAVSGAALLAYAVNKSMSVSEGPVSHAGLAELGALGMLVGVKLTW